MKKIFFFKRLRNFLLLMLVPMTFLMVLFSAHTANQIRKDLLEESQQTVSSINANLGQVITGASEQAKSISGNIRMSMALRHALLDEEVLYGDVLYLSSLRLALNSTVSASNYLESSYIYSFGGDRVVSSNNGLETLSAVEDQGWVDICNSMMDTEISCIKPRVVAKDKVNEHRILTICQRLFVQNNCIVMNINVDKLRENIDDLKINTYEIVYITDAQGTILASSGNSDEHGEQLIAELFRGEIPRESSWRKLVGEKVQITSVTSDNPTYYIISLLPKTAFWYGIKKEALQWAYVFLVAALMIILIAYSVTSRSFSNINEILDMFERAEKGLPVEAKKDVLRDEYEAILNNIVRMFINSSYLQLQLKEQQFKQENAELMALQLQINPHFLYNTLQTLDMQVKKTDPDGATGVIIRAVSDILKYALGDPGQNVTLKEELEYLKKYARIQEYRFGDFIIYYEIDDDVMDAEVFRLMLQPVVENSLIHGLRNLERKGYMKIVARQRDGWLKIRVVDNGHGMTKEELKELRDKLEKNEGSSIGLLNLNRRLILHYGRDSQIKVQTKKEYGTVVFFQIPYKKYLI